MQDSNNFYERPHNISEYEEIMSAVPCGILVTEADDDFTLLYVNEGYYNLVGYTPEEHYNKFGKRGASTMHPDEAALVARAAKEQMAKAGAFSAEVRLAHKTQGYIWVSLSGRLRVTENGHKVYVVVIDISDYVVALERLEKEHYFNTLVTSLTDDAFFEYDIASRTVRYSKNFADRLGIGEVVNDYPRPLIEKGLIAEDSMHVFEHKTIEASDEVFEEEMHYNLPDGSDVWYGGHYCVISDSYGKPVRIVGKMNDITKHKEKIVELSIKAEQDQLTGLYNKVTTEYLINEILKMRRFNDDRHALMIIDIDNFKNINDKLGHQYGDNVLTELAEALKPMFRSDDVIGRIGGDEFFVFMKNYNSVNKLKDKAQEICRVFDKTYTQDDVSVCISASVGIALCPEHGTNFDILYKSADSALYAEKEKGKNGYVIYDGRTSSYYNSTRME